MNKSKSFFNVLLILLIGGFGVQTFTSCSSDDDGGNFGCDFGTVMCFEFTSGMPLSDREDACDRGGGEKLPKGCPSNWLSKCRHDAGGGYYDIVYYYDQSMVSDSDCEQKSQGSTPSSSSSSSITIIKGTFKDDRDGNNYEWVKIGEQTWMAENLNYRGTEPDTLGVCYDNSPSNCDKYGRLYNWVTAMALPDSCKSSFCSSQIGAKYRGICPSGWHIPSNADWDVLMKFVNPRCSDNGSSDNGRCVGAGAKLKATSGWDNANGTDNYGFAALPGGGGDLTSSFSFFSGRGENGSWFSSSEHTAKISYAPSITHNDYVVPRSDAIKILSHSVRCLQD